MRALIDRKQIEPLSMDDIPIELKDAHWEYIQDAASSSWVIDLPDWLKDYPSVEIYNTGNSRIFGAINFITSKQVNILFNSPITGKVVFN